jgi:hypothetical protein
MSYGTLTIQDVEYDLTHLDDHVIHVPRPDGTATYRVLVRYGRHCFTRERLPGDHQDFLIADGNEIRCLCPVRTTMSRELKRIISEASQSVAYFTLEAKMLLVEDDAGVPYTVFFNIESALEKNLDAVMFIVSAYRKPNLPDRLPAVKFWSLVDKASKGFTPMKPQRTRSWKKPAAAAADPASAAAAAAE